MRSVGSNDESIHCCWKRTNPLYMYVVFQEDLLREILMESRY